MRMKRVFLLYFGGCCYRTRLGTHDFRCFRRLVKNNDIPTKDLEGPKAKIATYHQSASVRCRRSVHKATEAKSPAPRRFMPRFFTETHLHLLAPKPTMNWKYVLVDHGAVSRADTLNPPSYHWTQWSDWHASFFPLPHNTCTIITSKGIILPVLYHYVILNLQKNLFLCEKIKKLYWCWCRYPHSF